MPGSASHSALSQLGGGAVQRMGMKTIPWRATRCATRNSLLARFSKSGTHSSGTPRDSGCLLSMRFHVLRQRNPSRARSTISSLRTTDYWADKESARCASAASRPSACRLPGPKDPPRRLPAAIAAIDSWSLDLITSHSGDDFKGRQADSPNNDSDSVPAGA